MKPRYAYTVRSVRKKPTNLTISQGMRDRANRLMALHGFSSFSSFVEQLIREEHARRFETIALRDAPAPETKPEPPTQPVSCRTHNHKKRNPP